MPRTIKVDENGFESLTKMAIHRFCWQIVDPIIVNNKLILILIGNRYQYLIPRRSFKSEEEYFEFGKNLLELHESQKDQPIM